MSRFFIYYILSVPVLLLISCGNDQRPSGQLTRQKTSVQPVKKIALVAFKGTDSAMLAGMHAALVSEWTPEIVLIRTGPEPAAAFYPPRKRWIADSILAWLDRMEPGAGQKIAGISCHDISTRKDAHENWGVMGLGECPGRSCVVSSFRAKRGAAGFRPFMLRMRSLLFHELGHTFGLPHCPATGCIMEDAKGKMTLDGEKSFCNACRKRLQDMGLLRIR